MKKSSKIAVLVTAILLSALLFSTWLLLAFITVNKVFTSDYANYSTTKIVASSISDLSDDRYVGAIVTADTDGAFIDEIKQLRAQDKTAFVVFPSAKKEQLDAWTTDCLAVSSRSFLVFCSEDRKVLEQLYEENLNYFTYILLTKSAASAFIYNKMGYNCALPCAQITERTVQRAHDNDHLVIATGVKTEADAQQLQRLKVDYVFRSSPLK